MLEFLAIKQKQTKFSADIILGFQFIEINPQFRLDRLRHKIKTKPEIFCHYPHPNCTIFPKTHERYEQ